MDTLNRCHHSLQDDNSDKITSRGTNQLLATTGESIAIRTTSSFLPLPLLPRPPSSPSSSSTPASDGNKEQRHFGNTNPLFPLQTTRQHTKTKSEVNSADSLPRMPLISCASGAEAVQVLRYSPVVSLVSPEMEQEIESLNSILDYISTELKSLANDDEEEEGNEDQVDGDRVSQNEHEEDHHLNHHQTSANGVTGHEVRLRSGEILIHHPNDQQHLSSQTDPTPQSSSSRLAFSQKSLHDSTDTVIDGSSSSKDMSSSADFSDENDVVSKTDLTASEDELIDEGIQCNSGDQMIPFNHLTVLEIEAFLRKHRV